MSATAKLISESNYKLVFLKADEQFREIVRTAIVDSYPKGIKKLVWARFIIPCHYLLNNGRYTLSNSSEFWNGLYFSNKKKHLSKVLFLLLSGRKVGRQGGGWWRGSSWGILTILNITANFHWSLKVCFYLRESSDQVNDTELQVTLCVH